MAGAMKTYSVKKRAARYICLIMAVIMLSAAVMQPMSVGASELSPVPTDSSLRSEVSTIFERALEYYNRSHSKQLSNFSSLCALYVNIQLVLRGVNSEIIGGNGNQEFGQYRYLSYSSGGRKIHAYPIKQYTIYQALSAIQNTCSIATDVMVCFSATSTTAGKKYGHVMLIHGIIGDKVYFTENFRMRIGGVVYESGDVVVCTVTQFAAFYSQSIFTPEGIIWFEEESLTSAVNQGLSYYESESGGYEEPDPGTDEDEYTVGQYRIIYNGGMRLRKGPSTDYGYYGVIPNNSTISVTQVIDGWGKTFCTINGTDYEGWVCLGPDYTSRTGDLNPVAAETYASDGSLTSRQWYLSLEAAADDAQKGTILVVYGDIVLDSPVTIGDGVTLKTGNYSITSGNGAALQVRGGTVISDKILPIVENDPFATRTVSGSQYNYTGTCSLAIKAAALDIDNGIGARFTVDASGLPSGRTGFCAELAVTDEDENTTVTPGSYSGENTFDLVSDIIPADRLTDAVNVTARIYKTVEGVKYYQESALVCFTPSVYVGTVYGTDAGKTGGEDNGLDGLLAAVMNYSAAASDVTGHNASKPANLVLPESARGLTYDPTVLYTANGAPVSASNTTVHITSTVLDTDGALTLKFHSDASGTSNLKLLVFSPDKYSQLKKKAGNGDVTTLMTEANATAVLTADSEGYFSYDGFTAKQYADTYYYRLVETSGSTTKYDSVFGMSVTDYCTKVIFADPDSKSAVYCRAVCEFSAAARKYFGYTVR